jgi:TatD DNase family protein
LEGLDALGAIVFAETSSTLLLACGVDRKTSLATLKIASSNPSVRAFVGVHPSEALKERNLSWVRDSLEAAAGLGEVGLDPKYSSVGPGSTQARVFQAQLAEAKRAVKPVQVHSRGAETECLDALDESGLQKVLMHWFQSEESLSRVLDRGYFVSFGPSLVYSKRLQRMAGRCPTSQVLTETDFPVGYDPLAKARGPSLIPSVVFSLAEAWGVAFQDARAFSVENAMTFLSSSEKG